VCPFLCPSIGTAKVINHHTYIRKSDLVPEMNGHSFIPNLSQLKKSFSLGTSQNICNYCVVPTTIFELARRLDNFYRHISFSEKTKYFQHLCGIWSDLGTIPDNRTICTNLSSPSRSHCLRTGLILTGWSIILHRRQSLNITFHHFSHKYSTFKLIYIYRNNYL